MVVWAIRKNLRLDAPVDKGVADLIFKRFGASMVSPTAPNLKGQFYAEAKLVLLWLFKVSHAVPAVVTITVIMTAPARTIRTDGGRWGCSMRHG